MLLRVQRLIVLLVAIGVLLVPTVIAAAQAPDFRLPPGKEWPVVGGNWGNQRYSTLSQINTSNVKDLKGAWMARLNGSGIGSKYSQQATPVVKDGVMYISTGRDDVFALDAKTGAIQWEYSPEITPKGPGRFIWANRGVALGEGMVFEGMTDGNVVALDQKTGRIVWKTDVGVGEINHYGLTMAPLYFDGLLYTGLGGGDSGTRGRLHALDAKTGQEIWRFYTVPGPGEFGNDTWEGDTWKNGGAVIWNMPVIDPDLGMIYFGTGNAWPDYDGSVRGGDNLFTSSVVALDLKTGQYKWHYQLVHHDIWDYDAGNSPLLFDVTIAGQPRKALAQGAKMGWVYFLDRTNGQPLVGIDEQPVAQDPRQKTSPTQPFPRGDAIVPHCASDPVEGFQQGCIFDAFWDLPVQIGPGVLGGNDYAPNSFNPQTGLLYVAGSVINWAYAVAHETLDEASGKRFQVGGTGAFIPYGTKRSGTLTALDPTTNTIVWQKPLAFPGGMGSGMLSTAGGLVFHGNADGNVTAYDARTGDELWSFQTGFGADGPIISYELDGVQYIAIATGGNRLALSQRGDGLWAFALPPTGGLFPLSPPPAPKKAQVFGSDPVEINEARAGVGADWLGSEDHPPVPSEYSFGPERIKVPVGATVTFTNQGELAHTFTDQKGAWDTGLLQPGESKTITFDQPADYVYFCQPHPFMMGEILVGVEPE